LQTEPLLYEAYGVSGQVVHVFRHFPLDIHPNAPAAHKAAYCAGQQDPKLFWDMHDWLFPNQQAWQSSSADVAARQFRDQALAIGAEADAFDACLTDAQTEAAMAKDLQTGAELGVRGTPAFFLEKLGADGKVAESRPLSGALPYDQFAQALDALLE
jgi:protein-disulfide isomerase